MINEYKDFELENENEEAESTSILEEMVQTLNELPLDVLKQLNNNLDELEEWNKTHPDDED